MKRWAVAAGMAAIVVMFVVRRANPDPLPSFPRVMVWAWEAPQDLRFIKPGKAGIAFLARTVRFDERRVRSRSRMASLRYSPGTDLMAVVRLESVGQTDPPVEEVVAQTLPAVEISGVKALEVDFDARQSEHEWYAGFLRQLRRKLPARIPLVITALENWCEQERWIGGLPVVDATPMLFRMGPDDHKTPRGFAAAVCRSSVGVSTDEMPDHIPPARRIYIFHPGSWTREAYDVAVAQAWRWWR